MNEKHMNLNGHVDLYKKARFIRKMQSSKNLSSEIFEIKPKLAILSCKAEIFMKEMERNSKLWFRQHETSTKETVEYKTERQIGHDFISECDNAMQLEQEASEGGGSDDFFEEDRNISHLTHNSLGEGNDCEREKGDLNKTVGIPSFIFF